MFEKMNRKIAYGLSVALLLALLVAPLALASDVDVSVVDVTAPIGSVILAPGGSGSITINLTVTGKQEGTATFDVYRDWTLSGGAFTGSNSQTFTVPPRAAQDPATTFSTTGTVYVDIGQADGSYTLAVGVFNITNSNVTGAKLSAGDPSNYYVTVEAPPPPSDTTPPTIYCTVPDQSIWYGTDVTVNCTASDSESGLANESDASFSLSTSVNSGTETATALTGTKTVCDNANNCSTAGPYTFKVDKKAPTNISFVGGGLANGGEYYFGFVPDGPTGCTADDEGSGLASCDVSGYSNGVGSQKVIATAKDNVGNTSTGELHYTVLNWNLSGFYQPVDMNGVYNVVKGGSTVPLKFEVFAGSMELTDSTVVKSFVQAKIACDGTAPADDLEFTTTGGTSLRYDTTAGQFVQNWQTSKLPGQCYRVTMTTQDGSKLEAFFKLK